MQIPCALVLLTPIKYIWILHLEKLETFETKYNYYSQVIFNET